MEERSEEEMMKMYNTEKEVVVKTNELDYDTVQKIAEACKLTEEELLSRCLQTGLYAVAETIIDLGEQIEDPMLKMISEMLIGNDE